MLELRQVGKRFGNTEVLSEVNFRLGPGEIATLTGPSGCGKTTVLRLISGLEMLSQGEIHMEGRLVS